MVVRYIQPFSTFFVKKGISGVEKKGLFLIKWESNLRYQIQNIIVENGLSELQGSEKLFYATFRPANGTRDNLRKNIVRQSKRESRRTLRSINALANVFRW